MDNCKRLIPMVIRWPKRGQPGQVRDELVATVDILPTILDAAGEAMPAGLAGRSLMPLILIKGHFQ